MDKAAERQKQAYRPGTTANRQSAANSLISFAVDMSFEYTRPSPEEVCAYIEQLIARPMSPNAIKGHISSLKAFFRNAGLCIKVFESIQVSNALRAVDISIKHKPKLKLSISPQDISRIINLIDSYKHGKMVSFAIALMFTAFLRQSNLLSRTVKSFDQSRQITIGDVSLKKPLLKIDIKWSKTNQKFGNTSVITVSEMPGSTICPIARYLQTQIPRPKSPSSPLIRFPDGNPIPLPFVNKYWKQALMAIGIHNKGMTLHRLRLSGASWANEQGVPQLDICTQGQWQSQAFRSYIVQSNNKPNKVNNCMSSINTNAV